MVVNREEIFGDDWESLEKTVQRGSPMDNAANTPTIRTHGSQKKQSTLLGCITTVLIGIGALTVLLIGVYVVMMLVMGQAALKMGSRSMTRDVLRAGDPEAVVAIVSLHGIIEGGEYMRSGTGARFLNQLDILKDEPYLKAVIVDIDSPGGSATMSDVIYHRLGDVQVPKVALLGNIAASGGYYVAVACDRIVARPTSVTGSIGVILQVPQVFDLMEKIGIDMLTVKSATHKDLASPFRATDEVEEAMLQRTVDTIFQRFVQCVADGRSMDVQDVKKLADGRILAAPDALDANLIDAMGYREDAIAEAERLAEITNATVVRYKSSPGILGLLGVEQRSADPLTEITKLMRMHGPLFLYRGPLQ